MQKHNRTYRLIAAFTGFIIFAVAVFPTSLRAQHLFMEHCDMQEHVMDIAQQKECDEEHHPRSQASNSDRVQQNLVKHQHTECETGYTCACSAEQHTVVSTAPNTISRTKAELGTFVVDTIDHSITSTVFTTFAYITKRVDDASPPIFLKNSAFLN